MKKYLNLLLVFTLLIVLTGCGKSGTLTCKKSEVNDDGFNVESTIEVVYKNDIVTNVTETNIEEMDAEMVDFTVGFGQLFAQGLSELKGFNFEYSKESDTKVKYIVSVNYEEIDVQELEQTFKDLDEEADVNSLYTAKNQTIDEFKTNNLNGYTCE